MIAKSFKIIDSEVVYVDGLAGLRCWCCWRERTEFHDKYCRAPFSTAMNEFKAAIMEKFEPPLIKTCEAMVRLANWFERKFG